MSLIKKASRLATLCMMFLMNKSLPKPLRREGMSYLLKICNNLLAYPPLSELGLPSFRRGWGRLEGLGGLFFFKIKLQKCLVIVQV